MHLISRRQTAQVRRAQPRTQMGEIIDFTKNRQKHATVNAMHSQPVNSVCVCVTGQYAHKQRARTTGLRMTYSPATTCFVCTFKQEQHLHFTVLELGANTGRLV
jgi:hypothetical protein